MNSVTLIELGKKKKELFDDILSASRHLSLANQVDEMAEWLEKRDKILEDVKKTDAAISKVEEHLKSTLQKCDPVLSSNIKHTIKNVYENDSVILNRLNGKMNEIQLESKELSRSTKVKQYLTTAGRAS